MYGYDGKSGVYSESSTFVPYNWFMLVWKKISCVIQLFHTLSRFFFFVGSIYKTP